MWEASRINRRGRGVVARVTVGVKKLPPVACLLREPLLAEANGALKGREVRELWEILRVVSSGSANTFVGREVSELCDRSKVVSAVRSPNVVGRDTSLFLCS